MSAFVRRMLTLALAASIIFAAQRTKADAVTDWNVVLLSTIAAQNPFAQARFAAITQLAVFERAQGRAEGRADALRAVTDWIAEATLQ